MRTLSSFPPTFTPAAKTLDFSKLTGFDLRKLYAVVNMTADVPIYVPGVTSLGGTLSTDGTVLTLDYDTTSMASTDVLLVHYEDNSAAIADPGDTAAGAAVRGERGGQTLDVDGPNVAILESIDESLREIRLLLEMALA